MGETLKPDLCVIGAGSAGLSVAAGAVQMGASVVLVEKGKMGGDCLNTGCVPSKSLLAAAHRAASARKAHTLGVTLSANVDFTAVQRHVRSVIEDIAPHDSVERFEGLESVLSKPKPLSLTPRRFGLDQKQSSRAVLSSPPGRIPQCRRCRA